MVTFLRAIDRVNALVAGKSSLRPSAILSNLLERGVSSLPFSFKPTKHVVHCFATVTKTRGWLVSFELQAVFEGLASGNAGTTRFGGF